MPFGAVPLDDVTSITMAGWPPTVLDGFRLTTPNELMVESHIDDHGAGIRSLEIAAQTGAALV